MSSPLSPLQITASHIRVLKDQQEKAARAVWEARFKPVDVSKHVEKTHGTVCDDTYKALKRAEEERERASHMTQSQSEDLAVKLEHAAEKYDEIDRQEKEKLDGQMPAGG
jgi:hypothetical protein